VRPRHGVALPEQNSLNVGPCHDMASQGMTKKIRILNQFSKPVKDSVSVIINQYKSSVKRWCNKNGFKDFEWQVRFAKIGVSAVKINFTIFLSFIFSML